MSTGKIVSALLPAAMYHAGVPKDVRELVQRPDKKLMEAIEKKAAKDHVVFRAFADKVMKAMEDDEDDELHRAIGTLSYEPAKNERPPRAGYARQDASRSLVDHHVSRT